MVRRAVLLFIVLLPVWLAAQDMPFSVKSQTRYSASGLVGYEEVDSVKYYQFRLIQEFNYKKFQFGLDLDFLFDKHAHLKKEDWDNALDLLGKIYYMRYADQGDPFYIHIGGFPNRTMANGLAMLNYSNMQLYPDLRNTGLLMGGSPHWPLKPTLEFYTSNVEKNQILSLAAHIQPLPDSTVKNIDQTVVGFSLIMDRNQKGNLKHVMADSLYDQYYDDWNIGEGRSAAVFSLDYTMPMVSTEKVVFGHYAEIAHILDYGTGFILPGLYADFKFLKLNLEYRIYGSQFVPAFFDHSYEEERAVLVQDDLAAPYDSSDVVIKEQMLKDINSSQGWYGKIQGLIGKKIKVMTAWQDMYGKELKTGKSFWFRLAVDTQYKRLENFAFSYQKTNVEKMELQNLVVPGGKIEGKLTFRVSKKRWFLIGKYSETYKDKDKSGAIQWAKEAKRSVSVGVKYLF